MSCGNSMYELCVKSHFSAAHRLAGYKGACSRIHGHNWEVEVHVRGGELDGIGILVDFKKVRKAVESCLADLDHGDLNRLGAFRKSNPTSENIARHLFGKLSGMLNNRRCIVSRVVVSETAGSSVSYSEDEVQSVGKKRRSR